MVYRVRIILIVSGALALAACESSPDWMKMNTDAFKPQPILDTVRLESEPPGAEAKASSGQSCRTPCALALPVDAPQTVTFTLSGYQPQTENLEAIIQTGSPTQLGPNPLYAELTPGGPSSKAIKKPPPKKKPAAKQAAARSSSATATGSAPAPMSAEPSQLSPAPWPSTPPPRR